MQRREYVRGVLVGTGVLLAGCSDGSDESTDDPTIDPAESEEFAQHIKPHTDEALAALEESVGMCTTETAKFDTLEPGAIDVQIDPISTRLSDANSAIGNASSAPFSHRFQHYTRGLRQFHDWLRTFVPRLRAARSATEAWSAGIAAWQDEAFETAADTIGGTSQAPIPDHVPVPWGPGDDLVTYAENFDVDVFDRLSGWAADVETAFIALGSGAPQ